MSVAHPAVPPPAHQPASLSQLWGQIVDTGNSLLQTNFIQRHKDIILTIMGIALGILSLIYATIPTAIGVLTGLRFYDECEEIYKKVHDVFMEQIGNLRERHFLDQALFAVSASICLYAFPIFLYGFTYGCFASQIFTAATPPPPTPTAPSTPTRPTSPSSEGQEPPPPPRAPSTPLRDAALYARNLLSRVVPTTFSSHSEPGPEDS